MAHAAAPRSVAGKVSAQAIGACVLLVLALTLGGGRVDGLRGDAFLQLAALIVLFVTTLRLAEQPIERSALYLAAAIVALPLVQLVPLPPEAWSVLPGRQYAIESLQAASPGLPWWPLSLDPAATWRSFLSLLPALAMFLAVASLGPAGRRLLTLVGLAVAMVAVLLGLLQIMQGSSSPLRFYEITNRGSSVGFFANRNHHAALLYSLIPFAMAWTAWLMRHRDNQVLVLGAGLVVAALVLGAAMTNSRAGVALALAGLVVAMAGAERSGRAHRGGVLAALAAGALAAIAVVTYALPNVIGAFEQDHLADYRFDIFAISWEAARTFFPVGAGFGTFEAVYLIHDRPEALMGEYVNHAHNDWLELAIEGGLLAFAALALFLGWFAGRAWAVWRNRQGPAGALDNGLQRAASIAIVLVMLHSFVEFPLRNSAMLTVFAMCCALLTTPPGGWQRHPDSARGPRRRPGRRRMAAAGPAEPLGAGRR